MEEPNYNYPLSFQRQILKLCLESESFLTKNRDVLSSGYISYPNLAKLFKIVLDFYDKWQTKPSLPSIENEIDTNHSKHSETLINEFVNCLDVEEPDIEYLEGNIVSFAQNQALGLAIVESYDKWQTGDKEGVRDRIDKALSVGIRVKNQFIDFFDQDEQLEILKSMSNKEGVVPTIWQKVNKAMGGGAQPGTLNIFMAPPNFGKSWLLVNIGMGAIVSGKNVMHISTEMSRKKLMLRYGMSFTKMPSDKILLNPNAYFKRLEYFREDLESGLKITDYPSRSITAPQLETEVKGYISKEDFLPDLIVVDYADEMETHIKMPNRPDLQDGYIFAGLRAMAVRFHLPLWSATQSDRESLNKMRVSIGNISNSWDKAKISDTIWACMQTLEEQESNEFRMEDLKARDTAKLGQIKMKFNFNEGEVIEL